MKRSDDGSDKLGRRELLRRGALAGVTAGLLPFTGGRAARAEAQATVKRYAPWAAPGSRIRHSRESGNPGVVEGCYSGVSPLHPAWIPAFAGMTERGAGMTERGAELGRCNVSRPVDRLQRTKRAFSR